MFDIPPLWLDDSLFGFIVYSALSVAAIWIIKLIFKWIYKKKK